MKRPRQREIRRAKHQDYDMDSSESSLWREKQRTHQIVVRESQQSPRGNRKRPRLGGNTSNTGAKNRGILAAALILCTLWLKVGLPEICVAADQEQNKHLRQSQNHPIGALLQKNMKNLQATMQKDATTISSRRRANLSPDDAAYKLLTETGYITAFGKEPVCWKSNNSTSLNNLNLTRRHMQEGIELVAENISVPNPLVDGFSLRKGEETLPKCFEGSSLWVERPQEAIQGERLRTFSRYEYQVNLTLDLTTILNDPSVGNAVISRHPNQPQIAVQLLLCVLGTSGVCIPFLHDDAYVTEFFANDGQAPPPSNPGTIHGGTHADSKVIILDLEPNQTAVDTTVNIPLEMTAAGDYFVIAAVKFYTGDAATNTPYYRWDMANALEPQQRVLAYQDPPKILEVTRPVLLISYTMIIIASLIILVLIYETIRHRHEQVLQLSQGKFLLVFLFSALAATVCSVLLEPKNDLYCNLGSTLVLLPVQLMYAITAGRLWRINAVISPLLVEHMGNKSKWGSRYVGVIDFLSSVFTLRIFRKRLRRNQRRSRDVRRSIPQWQLAVVVWLFVSPQVTLQVVEAIWQRYIRTIEYNKDQSVGRAICQAPNATSLGSTILFYSLLVLLGLICVVLFVAYSSRKLPSLFNETKVMYDTTFISVVFILLGIGIVALTDGPTTDPDVQFFVWVTVTTAITLNCSLRIMVPKLKMIYKGEQVIVSKLVSDHHRKRRLKGLRDMRKAAGDEKDLLHNVTGIDECDTSLYNRSYMGSSHHFPSSHHSRFLSNYQASLTRANSGAASNLSFPNSSDRTHPRSNPKMNLQSSDTTTKHSNFHRNDFAHNSEVQMGLREDDEGDEDDQSFAGDNGKGMVAEGSEFDQPESPKPAYVARATESTDLEDVEESLELEELVNRKSIAASQEGGHSEPKAKGEGGASGREEIGGSSISLKFNNSLAGSASTSFRPPGTESLGTSGGSLGERDYVTGKPKNRRLRRLLSPRYTRDKEKENGTATSTADISPGSRGSLFEALGGASLRRPARQRNKSDESAADDIRGSRRSTSPLRLKSKSRSPSPKPGPLSPQRGKLPRGISIPKNLGAKTQMSERSTGVHHRDRRASERMRVAPDETPARRLVLRMVGLQEHLASVNMKIMSGLLVSPEEWDRLTLLNEKLHTTFERDVDFSWRDALEAERQQAMAQNQQGPWLKGEGGQGLERVQSWQAQWLKGQRAPSRIQSPHRTMESNDLAKPQATTRQHSDASQSLIMPELATRQTIADMRLSNKPQVVARQTSGNSWAPVTSPTGNHSPQSKRYTIRRGSVSNSADLAIKFRNIVDVRDRRKSLVRHKQCFIGKDAVSSMVFNEVASSREEAVRLGIFLAKDMHLFRSVQGDADFNDDDNFYRFVDLDDYWSSSGEEEEEEVEIEFESELFPSLMEDLHEEDDDGEAEKFDLARKAAAFRECALLKDHTYRMKTYRNCFVGSEVVDSLVYAGVAASRWEAVQLGRKLAREYRLFRHVRGHHEFKDEYSLYRFCDQGRPSKTLNNDAADSSQFDGNSIISQRVDVASLRSHQTDGVSLQSQRNDLADQADAFRMYVHPTNRKYRFQKWKNVFVGCEAVDALIEAGVAANRLDAVALGRRLMKELRLFTSIRGDDYFSDTQSFYRFNGDEHVVRRPSVDASNSLRRQSQRFTKKNADPAGKSELEKIAKDFCSIVEVKSRKYRLRTYKNCFVGAEAVDAMLAKGLANTRRAAVELGRAMVIELHLFRSLTGNELFSDDYSFYRFNDTDHSSDGAGDDRAKVMRDIRRVGSQKQADEGAESESGNALHGDALNNSPRSTSSNAQSAQTKDDGQQRESQVCTTPQASPTSNVQSSRDSLLNSEELTESLLFHMSTGGLLGLDMVPEGGREGESRDLDTDSHSGDHVSSV